MAKKVALIRGDGIGPELMDNAFKVFDTTNPDVEFLNVDAGLEWWQAHGGESFFSPEAFEILEGADACFKAPTTTLYTPGTPRSIVVTLRQKFDLYANVRPIRTFPNRAGPLGYVDFVFVRENTEGLYSGLDYRLSDDVAVTIRKVTKKASERIARYAFEEAKRRGWKKIVIIGKPNILRETDSLFFGCARSVGQSYAGIELEECLIDNFAQQLILNPQQYNENVILGTNLFIDILSEEASALIGGIGCIYAANIGDRYALFEPAHGSAPKFKGSDKMNPTATLLAGAWMLEYLGEEEEGRAVREATVQIISEGKYITFDLGGGARTSEMTAAIAARVKKLLPR